MRILRSPALIMLRGLLTGSRRRPVRRYPVRRRRVLGRMRLVRLFRALRVLGFRRVLSGCRRIRMRPRGPPLCRRMRLVGHRRMRLVGHRRMRLVGRPSRMARWCPGRIRLSRLRRRRPGTPPFRVLGFRRVLSGCRRIRMRPRGPPLCRRMRLVGHRRMRLVGHRRMRLVGRPSRMARWCPGRIRLSRLRRRRPGTPPPTLTSRRIPDPRPPGPPASFPRPSPVTRG